MRFALLLLFFVLSFQFASAQENTNQIITADNVDLIIPQLSIDEAFAWALFSEFNPENPSLFLLDEETPDENDRYQSSIVTWDISTEETSNTIEFESYGVISFPIEIPSQGKFIIVTSQGVLHLFDYPAGNNLEHPFDSSEFAYEFVAISSDTSRFATTGCERANFTIMGCYPEVWNVFIYETSDFEQLNTISIETHRINGLSLSDNGGLLAVEANNGDLMIYDTNSSEQLAIHEPRCRLDYWNSYAYFLDDETIIAIQPACTNIPNYFEENLIVWNFRTGEERIVFNINGGIDDFDFSPDGTILGVLAVSDGISNLYFVEPATGRILSELESVGAYYFDFSPDGRYLLSGTLIFGIPAKAY